MSWPTPQDYNEAIQNPRLAFADSELQTGRPDLTPLGLPRPISGGFASVYRLQCVKNSWAVRCFLRDFDDQQRRYSAISDQLAQASLPYTVGFTFLRQGIRIRGQWYPILKMEWVQGEPLHLFIEKHIGNPNALLSLAGRWVQMMRTLKQASIAHGDLQHGNVFVVGGDLRLIDYDGMYVPALSGQVSHEIGHRNYQHPLRTVSDFGPHLDNFSAWVIYLSLIALTVEPTLWQRFGGGDECLLFRQKDFERPEDSDTLHTLETCRDDRIRSAATLFKSLLYFGPQQVPPLDGQMVPLALPSSSSWIDDHVSRPKASVSAKQTSEYGLVEPQHQPTSADPSWILDFLVPTPVTIPSASFRNSANPERLVLLTSFIATLLFITMAPLNMMGMYMSGLLTLLMILGNLVLWVCRYRLDPVASEIARHMTKLKGINEQIQGATAALEMGEKEKKNHRNREAEEQEKILNNQKAVKEKEKKELDAIQEIFQRVLSSINSRRRTASQQEADSLRNLQNVIGGKVISLDQQINMLQQAETTDLVNTLQAQQSQYVGAYLRSISLDGAEVSGVGQVFKARLKAAGVHTAADIDLYRVQRVRGIGSSRATSLIAWKRSIESQARTSIPKALSQSEIANIQEKYQRQQRVLKEEKDREQQRQKREDQTIRAGCRRSLEQLDTEERVAGTKCKREGDEIKSRYAPQYRVFQEALSTLPGGTESKIREIDSSAGETRKELFRLHWEKGKANQEIEPFRGLRFQNYVKRIFFGSRAA